MTARERNDKAFEKAKAAIEAKELTVGEALEKFKITSAAYYSRLNKGKETESKRGAKPLSEAADRVTMQEVEAARATGKTLIIVPSSDAMALGLIAMFIRGEA